MICDTSGVGTPENGPLTLKFEFNRDFCKMHVPTKFRRYTFNRSEVIGFTNKQTNKAIQSKTSGSLRYTATPVENRAKFGSVKRKQRPRRPLQSGMSGYQLPSVPHMDVMLKRPFVRTCPSAHDTFTTVPGVTSDVLTTRENDTGRHSIAVHPCTNNSLPPTLPTSTE